MKVQNKSPALIWLTTFIVCFNTQKIQIFQYAIQNNLTNSVYNITKQSWQLSFWMMMHSKQSLSINTILRFLNTNGDITTLYLDDNNQVMINDQFNNLIQLCTMSQTTNLSSDFLSQRKTYDSKWYAVIFYYVNSSFNIYIQNANKSIQTFDYSSTNSGQIDFGSLVSNCVLYFTNVYIDDPYMTVNNYKDIQYDKKLLGFYFFPFLSQNRQYVENVYDPTQMPLIIEEYGLAPSSLFQDYQTNNVFSQMKITFPNFWSHFAFYGIKMAINFSLVFKVKMQNTTTNYTNQIKLYHRDLLFGSPSLLTSFSTALYVQSSVNNTTNPVNYQYNASFNLSYLEQGTIIQSGIYSSSKVFNDIQNIMNFQYLQNIRADYTVSNSIQNIYKIFMNTSQNQIIINNAIFSSQDQHYCGFSIQGSNNYYFSIMIQEIIFYQDIELNIDQSFIDSNKTISLNCSLDDSLPYFQERFLINNNNILTLKNCRRLDYLQRCNQFYKCLRCQYNKCIKCADSYYLKNGRCLLCQFPFVIVNEHCIYTNRTFISILQPYSNQEINNFVTYSNGLLSYNIFVQIELVNSSGFSYQKVLLSYDSFDWFNNKLTPLKDFLINYFLLALNEISFQFRIAVIHTQNLANFVSNTSTFKCINYSLHIQGQHLQCLTTCSSGSYLRSSLYCLKNNQGCLTQTQSTYIKCTSCDTNYMLLQDTSNTSASCQSLSTSQNKTLVQIQSQTSIETYDDNQYIYGLVTYPICDINSSQYLVGTSCNTINQTQADFCTILDVNGQCDLISSTNTAVGQLLQSNGTLYDYFQINYTNWQTLQCKTTETFENTTYNIQNIYDVCLWTTHILNSKPNTCQLNDPNCQSCNTTNTNMCQTCITGTLIQFQYQTLCEQAIPNCTQHTLYQENLYCEQCQSGYNLVQTDYDTKPIGYCIQTLIPGCEIYEIINGTTVQCSTACPNGYTNTNLVDPVCVLNQEYVNQCSQYSGDAINGYICIDCQTGFDCLTSDGLIDNIVSINNPCTFCLNQLSKVMNCYVFNSSQQCIQCYTTHHLQDPLTCVSNCSTIDPIDSSLCVSCISGTIFQDQLCYQNIFACDVHSNIGCNTCNIYSTLFQDTDKLFKCQLQHLNCQTISNLNTNYCFQCDVGYRIFRHSDDFDICVLAINNCINYSTINYYLCDTCQVNFRIFSQSNNYDLCEQEIVNCQLYNISDKLLCDTCAIGFRKFSQQNDYDICSQIIENCQTYSTLNQYTCDQCIADYRQFQQIGDFDLCAIIIQNCQIHSTTDYLVCDQCITNFRIFSQTSQYDICSEVINDCQTYSTSNFYNCQTCMNGFRIVTQLNNFDMCSLIIDNCIQYDQNNPALCTNCANTFKLSADQSQCNLTQVQNQPTQDIIQQEQQNDPIQQIQVNGAECYQPIKNCKLCQNNYCLECQQNYYLYQNICQPNCLLNTQSCVECEILDQSKCLSCSNGQFLQFQKCENPCSISIFGATCFVEQCLQLDQNCVSCSKQDLEKCSQCKEGYYINQNRICYPKQNILIEQIYSQKLCEDFCKACIISQCLRCKMMFQQQFDECIIQQNFVLRENLLSNIKCQDQTICFYNNEVMNQHCQNCLNFCIINIRQEMNVFEINSQFDLKFKRYIKNVKDYVFLFNDKRPNQLQIEILNLHMEKLQLQVPRGQIIQQSYNCTPYSYYDLNKKNIFFNYKEIRKNKSKIEGITMGVFLSSFQLAFPSWLIIYIINSLQKIDILSYVAFTNLNGGSFYDFMNSFPESEVQTITQEKNQQKEYLKDFKLLQFQLHYFNLINEASVLTLFSLLIGIIFTILWTYLKFIKEKFGDRIILIFEAVKNKIVYYQYSFLGILQIHILPQAIRFFVIQECFSFKKKLIIFAFDFFICYLALKRLIYHFNFNSINNAREKKVLTIFVNDQIRLKDFESLFNYWIALDQTLCLIKDNLLFVFQYDFLTILVFVQILSVCQLCYYLYQLKKYGGIMKKLLLNFFLSELLFLIFLFLMSITFVQNKDNQLNNIFNIVYIALNLFKILETVSAAHTVKKISQNKLSHLQIKRQTRHVMSKTTDQYKLDYDLHQIQKSTVLINKKLAKNIRFEKNFSALQNSRFKNSQKQFEQLSQF